MPRRARLAPLVYGIAGLKLLVHVVFIRGYGWFRDEFYYIACSERLDWGYVDHPPLVAVITAITRATLGESIVALRLPPALSGAATVLVAGLLARDLGAGRAGQALAAVGVAGGLGYLSLQHILSMNAWEPLAWSLVAWLLVRALTTGRVAWWAWAGIVAGLGLQNKHSMAFFGAAIAAGLAISSSRRVLMQRGPWIVAGIATVIFLPHVAWQAHHGWPVLEFVSNAQQHKNNALPPVRFVVQQVLMMNPVGLAIWGAGLAWLLAAPAAERWRVFGWAYLALLAFFVASGGKDYYLAPYYPILFAAGGVALEQWTAGMRWRTAARAAAAVAVLAAAAVFAPLAMPILPVPQFVRYAAALGVTSEASERHEFGRLPQLFADMHGWGALVDEVVQAAGTLTPAERARAVIVVNNYGEAGAINFLGRGRGAPLAVSGHNNYWLWGPAHASQEVLLVLGGTAQDHAECTSLIQAGHFRCTDCMPYEDDQRIWVCRGLTVPIGDAWREMKHFN